MLITIDIRNRAYMHNENKDILYVFLHYEHVCCEHLFEIIYSIWCQQRLLITIDIRNQAYMHKLKKWILYMSNCITNTCVLKKNLLLLALTSVQIYHKSNECLKNRNKTIMLLFKLATINIFINLPIWLKLNISLRLAAVYYQSFKVGYY